MEGQGQFVLARGPPFHFFPEIVSDFQWRKNKGEGETEEITSDPEGGEETTKKGGKREPLPLPKKSDPSPVEMFCRRVCSDNTEPDFWRVGKEADAWWKFFLVPALSVTSRYGTESDV